MTEHLITTATEVETCPRCGAPMLVGHWSGLLIRADVVNLTAADEAAALAAGLMTFDLLLLGYPRRLYFEHRDPDRTTSEHAHPVVRDHRCARPIPTRLF